MASRSRPGRKARLRVLVAEDHPLYRDGLVRVLKSRPELELVSDVSTGREALDAVRTISPDVALLDIALPDIDGIAVLEEVERESQTLVVFLSAHDDSPTVYRALAAGARGYLPKASSAEEICNAVVAVGRGETVIPRELQAGLRQELRLHHETSVVPALSPRELEILRLAAQGRSITEMADDLTIAATTVKTHLRHIYDKLEAPDRTAAVAQAFRHGLLH